MTKKTTRNKFNDEERKHAVARLNAGESGEKIAKDLGVANAVIYQWRKKFRQLENPVLPVQVNTHDAILYLRNARRFIMKEAQGGKQLDEAQLLVLLALKSLEGKS